MSSADVLARVAAIAGAAVADDVDVDFLLECLGADRKVVQRRAAEALAVAAPGDDVRARLETALAAPSRRQRWGAAYALSRRGALSARCLPVLLEALDEDDGDLRWAAATLVLELRAHAPLEAALRALARDGGPPGRKMALYCLRDLDARSPALSAEVHAALADADAGVRLAAMSTLARMAPADPAVARALAVRLRDDDLGVRRAAAATMGRLPAVPDDARAALVAASADPDAALARAAANALAALAAR